MTTNQPKGADMPNALVNRFLDRADYFYRMADESRADGHFVEADAYEEQANLAIDAASDIRNGR